MGKEKGKWLMLLVLLMLVKLTIEETIKIKEIKRKESGKWGQTNQSQKAKTRREAEEIRGGSKKWPN